MAVPTAPVRVPGQRPLAPSVTSITNDKGDNEMVPGTVHRSPDVCLTAEKNPGKPQLGLCLMKGLCDQSLPQFPFLQMRSVGSHSMSGRKEGGDDPN